MLVFRASGEWVVAAVSGVDRQLRDIDAGHGRVKQAVFDLGEVTRFDTSAAVILSRCAYALEQGGARIEFRNLNEAQSLLLDKLAQDGPPEPVEKHDVGLYAHVAGNMGDAVLAVSRETVGIVEFLGDVVAAVGRTIRRPARLRWVPFVYHMERAGFDALPLICLLTFLIGAVLAQQGATQLAKFGADYFTVNMVTIVFLREVGLLLTAIIVAGRSGSAFTAEIGSMKMREEIDAMRTLGLDPMDMLILPRVLALVVTLPMLAFVADLMGLLGGGVVSYFMLGMSPGLYIDRVRDAADFWTFAVGIIKAPFMAALIAMVGCRAGLLVTGSAESVGQQTTHSVVRSIFLVIIVDAIFAMFFTAVGV
ncbi:phospholipid/cholesterol/gamma-HCH transport system permease protein [Parvibaculum indicum]|uniref:ABC transporter permease n=1 Tax=Parvibaculum indicum TaxID=562969 RepID=UPI001422DCF8|nr:MlaE family lipid ABC transporter permease subunit [Parvibaculum indicum]NIJ41087.1 phospholipid/cholesterol/gamma-HCH transport system permease protein [Parvibaculum indicum]